MRIGRVVAGSLAVASLCAGCSPASAPLTDAEKIVRGVLMIQAGPRGNLCVDSRTRGEPLTAFRTMTAAPIPSRRPLAWRRPSRLQPANDLSTRQIFDDQIRQERLRIPEPSQASPPLPSEVQRRLDKAAFALSLRDNEGSVSVERAWPSPRVEARWWLLNRMRRDCLPNYTISHPVLVQDIGFVTITAEHWGQTYAFERQGTNWRPAAMWSAWLY